MYEEAYIAMIVPIRLSFDPYILTFLSNIVCSLLIICPSLAKVYLWMTMPGAENNKEAQTYRFLPQSKLIFALEFWVLDEMKRFVIGKFALVSTQILHHFKLKIGQKGFPITTIACLNISHLNCKYWKCSTIIKYDKSFKQTGKMPNDQRKSCNLWS